jgi:hypothetical protein
MKTHTNSIHQQSHRLRLPIGISDTIQQTGGGHSIRDLIGTEHPTLQGEREVMEANNVRVHSSSCSIFSSAFNSLSSSLASALLFRVTKDMSIAVAVCFLEEADAAVADKTASRAQTRMPRWPGPRRAPRIPLPRRRWPHGGRKRARSFLAWTADVGGRRWRQRGACQRGKAKRHCRVEEP